MENVHAEMYATMIEYNSSENDFIVSIGPLFFLKL